MNRATIAEYRIDARRSGTLAQSSGLHGLRFMRRRNFYRGARNSADNTSFREMETRTNGLRGERPQACAREKPVSPIQSCTLR